LASPLKVQFYSKRELKEIEQSLASRWGKLGLPELGIERRGEVEEGLYFMLGKHYLVDVKGTVLPFVGAEELLRYFPAVKVDMGAVKFLTNGANVMRPGIREFVGDFVKGDVVIVQDEKHGKAIAVGLAMMDRADAEAVAKGPVIKNVHYVGDRFWAAFKEMEMSSEASG